MRTKKDRFISADAPDVYCFSNPGSQQSSLQLVRFPNHVSCDKNCYCVAVAPSCSRPQGLRGRGGVLSVALQLGHHVLLLLVDHPADHLCVASINSGCSGDVS